MAVEIEVSDQDIRANLSEEQCNALEKELEHLGAIPLDKAGTILRAILAKLHSVAPDGFSVSKCSFDAKIKGSPFGVGLNMSVKVEVTPQPEST